MQLSDDKALLGSFSPWTSLFAPVIRPGLPALFPMSAVRSFAGCALTTVTWLFGALFFRILLRRIVSRCGPVWLLSCTLRAQFLLWKLSEWGFFAPTTGKGMEWVEEREEDPSEMDLRGFSREETHAAIVPGPVSCR
jgi:hypothetical protein